MLCDLVPGGVADEITAGHAARILGQIRPAGPAAEARTELAAELLAGIRHLDAQRRQVNKKLTTAVKSSGTTVTEIFGVGPVVAATVIGAVVGVARFPTWGHFAAYNGTAPVEGVLRREEDLPAVAARQPQAQSRDPHGRDHPDLARDSNCRACYQRKIAEGKTHKEAQRCLKRRISNAIYARLRADARKGGPGGQPGSHSVSRAAGSHPEHRHFGQATPGPKTSLRAGRTDAGHAAARASVQRPREPLDNG